MRLCATEKTDRPLFGAVASEDRAGISDGDAVELAIKARAWTSRAARGSAIWN